MKFRTFIDVSIWTTAILVCGLIAIESWPQHRKLIKDVTKPDSADELAYRRIGYVPRMFAAFVARDGKIYGIEDHFIYRSDDLGLTFNRVGVLPDKGTRLINRVKEKAARSRVAQLVGKKRGPRNLVVLESRTVLVIGAGGIFRSTDEGRTIDLVFDLAAEGMYAPFPVGTAVTPDGMVYFGEYVAGTGTRPIRIIEGRRDGTEWRVVHTFDAGTIRHVHSVEYDPYRDRLWVCTGDTSQQAQLFYTSDRFETLQRLGGGTQDWRIVSLMITPDHLYWGSDNDTSEGATIFRWHFADERLQPLQYIGKPGYFSTILSDGTLVLSTAYEGGSRYARYARPSPTAEIWASKDGINWRSVVTLESDTLNPRFGVPRSTIAFPAGAPTANLMYSPRGTRRNDFTTQIIELH